MSNIYALYVDNDMVLQIDDLKDEIAGEAINNATVTVTLSDEQGNEVLGAQWPLSLVHVATSNGAYRVTLPYTLEVTPGARYVATVVADAGPGLRAQWDAEVVARRRN